MLHLDVPCLVLDKERGHSLVHLLNVYVLRLPTPVQWLPSNMSNQVFFDDDALHPALLLVWIVYKTNH